MRRNARTRSGRQISCPSVVFADRVALEPARRAPAMCPLRSGRLVAGLAPAAQPAHWCHRQQFIRDGSSAPLAISVVATSYPIEGSVDLLDRPTGGRDAHDRQRALTINPLEIETLRAMSDGSFAPCELQFEFANPQVPRECQQVPLVAIVAQRGRLPVKAAQDEIVSASRGHTDHVGLLRSSARTVCTTAAPTWMSCRKATMETMHANSRVRVMTAFRGANVKSRLSTVRTPVSGHARRILCQGCCRPSAMLARRSPAREGGDGATELVLIVCASVETSAERL